MPEPRFSLSRSQWVEVFNAVGPRLQKRIIRSGDDADIEMGGPSDSICRFDDGDWRTIYDQVWNKLNNHPSVRGSDTTAREWRLELREILETLAPVAYCESCGVVDVPLRATTRYPEYDGVNKKRACADCCTGGLFPAQQTPYHRFVAHGSLPLACRSCGKPHDNWRHHKRREMKALRDAAVRS